MLFGFPSAHTELPLCTSKVPPTNPAKLVIHPTNPIDSDSAHTQCIIKYNWRGAIKIHVTFVFAQLIIINYRRASLRFHTQLGSQLYARIYFIFIDMVSNW